MKTSTLSAFLALAVVAVLATSGPATFYDGGLGACGTIIKNTDFAVALTAPNFASGAHCGQPITVTFNGKSITVIVQDLCPGCGTNGLDLTRGAFAALASTDLGVIQVDWQFGSSIPSNPPVGGECTKSYTVVSGDTCNLVEAKNGVSDATLHSLNPAINSGCTNLQIGQVLCVAGKNGGSGSCPQKYTVVSGDNCAAIEARFGLSDSALHSMNPSINSGCTNLQIGQVLCV
ncbi:RlpA-like double-psi beta-barrel-protein domain-containing protein-containing protein [Roridomyces roridus]|uniref:RlpA-like double-psi beta-barrel-protein domain-containing protein-containing protein n=1 Tax=Roridomyces roridus TaxID=1738132 RepID=A0AAD7BIP4_9AGAR|nr:RlpA-like double-psi beta-barrel-protein domain-containing protein-containing protein [Roridomyces roridus]